MTILNFQSSKVDLDALLDLGSGKDDFQVDVFKRVFTNVAAPEPNVVDSFLISGEFAFDMEFGLALDLVDVAAGDLSLDFPVDVDLVQPPVVTAGREFEFGVKDDFDVFGATLDGATVSYDDLTLSLFAESGGVQATDVSFLNTVFGSGVELGDFSFGQFDRFEVPIVKVLDAALDLSILPGLNFSIGSPSGSRKTGDGEGSGIDGNLPVLDEVFRDPLLTLEADLFKLLSGGNPASPTALLAPEVGLEFTAFGTTFSASLEVVLLQLFASIGYDIVQTVQFDPTKIKATYNFEGETFDRDFGTVFNFEVPEVGSAALADGTLDGFMEFDLQGAVTAAIDLVPTGAIGANSLGFSFSASAGDVGISAGVAPLFSTEIRADGEAIPLFEAIDVPLPDEALKPVRVSFAIPVTEATPPELLGLVGALNVSGAEATPLDLSAARLQDEDTFESIRLRLTVSEGSLTAETTDQVLVRGSGTRNVSLFGLEDDITAFLNDQRVSFDPDGATGTVTLSFTGNDFEGHPGTDLGSTNIRILGGPGDPVNIGEGTDGNDFLFGEEENDALIGGLGNDTLEDNRGNNTLVGGPGNDLLDSRPRLNVDDQAPNNLMIGGPGNDVLRGSSGNDTAIGGEGDDTLALRGDSLIGFTNGLDSASGGPGNDRIEGNLDQNTLLGGAGNDTILGGGPGSIIEGGDGDDSITGNDGAAKVDGGAGNDTVVTRNIALVTGGTGNDVVSGSNATGITIEGGEGNDSLVGSADPGTDSAVIGGVGNDTLGGNVKLLDGGAGDDDIAGGFDGSTIKGGEGNNTIRLTAFNDRVEAGTGNDVISMFDLPSSNFDSVGTKTIEVRAGEGNNTIDFLQGRPPETVSFDIRSGGGNDQIRLTSIFDSVERVSAGDGNNIVRGVGDGDRVTTGTGNDLILESAFSDEPPDVALRASDRRSAGDSAVSSGDGDDIIDVGVGQDTVRSGDGNDLIFVRSDTADEGASLYIAGAGNDTLRGEDVLFSETLNRAGAGDTLRGGDGDDVFERTGFGVTVEGGDGIDSFNTDALVRGLRSVTVDLRAGVFQNNEDPSERSQVTEIENVTLLPRVSTVLDYSFGDVEGLSDELDLALTAVPAGTFRLSGPTDLVIGNGAANRVIVENHGRARVEGRGGDDFLKALDSTEAERGTLGVFFDGGAGVDTLIGSGGSDTLVGSVEDSLLDGRDGLDLVDLSGEASAGGLLIDLSNASGNLGVLDGSFYALNNIENVLGRERGSDTLIGGESTTLLRTQRGDDVVGLSSLESRAVADGGQGNDTFLANTDLDVTIGLAPIANPLNPFLPGFGGFAHVSSGFIPSTATDLQNFENAITGSGDDQIDGNDLGNLLAAGEGNDTLNGLIGRDTLDGGDGDDLMDGGEGNDELIGGLGNNTLTGGAGRDTFVYRDGILGTDVITDFTPGEDRLEIQTARPRDLRVREVDGDTVITVRGQAGSITLEGADRAAAQDDIARSALPSLDDLNAAPFARADGFVVDRLKRLGGDLLGNNGFGRDLDLEDDALTITAVNGDAAAVGRFIDLPSGAQLKVNADGTFRYNPDGAFDTVTVARSELESFTYTVSDGEGSDEGTVGITVAGPTGGTKGADDLFGGAGNQRLAAKGGRDTVDGGSGDDSLTGGGGSDSLIGGTGNDTLLGSNGSDTLQGGVGADELRGGGANDQLIGGPGADTLDGGARNDVIETGSGADTIRLNDRGGQDRVTDFSVRQDSLEFDAEIFARSFGPAQIVNRFAEVTDAGVLFDFGRETLLLEGLTSVDGLADVITVV